MKVMSQVRGIRSYLGIEFGVQVRMERLASPLYYVTKSNATNSIRNGHVRKGARRLGSAYQGWHWRLLDIWQNKRRFKETEMKTLRRKNYSLDEQVQCHGYWKQDSSPARQGYIGEHDLPPTE